MKAQNGQQWQLADRLTELDATLDPLVTRLDAMPEAAV
jgi:hypothetical protein